MWPFSSSPYKALSEGKQRRRAEAVSTAPRFTPNEHGPFLKATASEIVERIRRGEWTSLQVVSAYIARTALAQETTNCVTEALFADALQQARDLDAEFVSSKTLRGPLHGVPVSFKDQYDIMGVDSTMGFSALVQKPAENDADVVALLKSAGAIPIVKTNVPQTMFSFECSNPVFGRTTNPYNQGYTSGGSSGGEAALLAMDGAALGVGSDVGGSLRIPSAYCGIYALKPSPLRVAYGGAGVVVPGFDAITSVGGPMGRSVEDLVIFCRITFGVQGRDPAVAPVLYREPKLPVKLRFGYYTDYYIKASPANHRAILETVAALRNSGHECIEFEVPDPTEPFDIFVGLTSADGYKTLLSNIESDPLVKCFCIFAYALSLSFRIKDSSLFVVAHGTGLPLPTDTIQDAKFAASLRATGVKPVREYWGWLARRDRYIAKFYDQVWNKLGLDGIIAPVQALPQVSNGNFTTLFSLATATILYNVVNSPVGCIPVTRIDPAKDGLTEEWTRAPSPSLVESALYHGKNPVYDPIAMRGMPIGIQLVGRKWEDEKVLAMMRVVDDALGKDRGFGPANWDEQDKL
ncbi:amidase [Mycena belliarum]|uniref:amidase n=1 Tax=Mycena belliarum TaxID=1033014 RepID=A0AAD6U5K5_9AGAR|nr:amidase [Mycena belliae]